MGLIRNKKGNKCRLCGVNTVMKQNKLYYKGICVSCHRKPYTLFKKNYCECCGFIPVHMCQLDVDHIDGNKENNNPENFRTLCANCHRLKTRIEEDYLNN
jgi:hypothetical protein